MHSQNDGQGAASQRKNHGKTKSGIPGDILDSKDKVNLKQSMGGKNGINGSKSQRDLSANRSPMKNNKATAGGKQQNYDNNVE